MNMMNNRYQLFSLDASMATSPTSASLSSGSPTGSSSLQSEHPGDCKYLTQETVVGNPSMTIKELQNAIETRHGKDCSYVFAGGKRLHPDSLAITSPTHSLTWTSSETGFRVVETVCLQMLFDRGEGYRLNQVLKALREINFRNHKGSRAVRASSGSGGVYFIKPASSPSSQILACFKPRDDEPGARNNPNLRSVRDGVLPGEAAEREAAAFILDWGGFSGVPGTLLVEAACETFGYRDGFSAAPKIGSLQYFVPNASDTVGDFSPHLFAPREVHKIGILDIRYLNVDRNDSNILVTQRNREYILVPIDHGLCFPDRIEVGWCDWVWWDWPQILCPFDQETRDWVMALDPFEDAKILRKCFSLRTECIRLFIAMTMLLQKGVAAGLNLHDIAGVVIRSRDIDEPSAMEKTIVRADELAQLMEANAKVRMSPSKNGKVLHRSSSFDGNLGSASSLNGGNKSTPHDDVFFSYVDRLLEDVVAEILHKKFAAKTNGSNSETDFDGSWFSLSTRSSPCELTKIASPRLLSNKGSPLDQNRQRLPSVPALSLHQ